MVTWRDRIKGLIKERELSMKSLSLKAGLSESAVRDAVTRGRDPSIDNFVKIAEALGVSPVWLLQGDERFRLKVPTIGVATIHETWQAKPLKAASAQFDIDVAGSDVIAIRIEGDAMSPVYRDGDELLCERRTGAFVDNLVGTDCVVETEDGRRFIKVIARGSKPGCFNLRSFNPMIKDVENVRIAWAAPIVMIKRGVGR